HSMDDSTDLQSTLEPQDSRFPGLERSNSVNDQRHRWVTSAVFQSSPHKSGESFWNSFLSNFTLAPLVELSSGRPYNVITGTDTRLDLGASQDRPSVVAAGTAGATTSPYIPGVAFIEASTCLLANGSTFTVPGITPPYGCIGNLGQCLPDAGFLPVRHARIQRHQPWRALPAGPDRRRFQPAQPHEHSCREPVVRSVGGCGLCCGPTLGCLRRPAIPVRSQAELVAPFTISLHEGGPAPLGPLFFVPSSFLRSGRQL